MASARQIEANRRNATHSTGPQTATGFTRVKELQGLKCDNALAVNAHSEAIVPSSSSQLHALAARSSAPRTPLLLCHTPFCSDFGTAFLT
jgi:hypothetical protein